MNVNSIKYNQSFGKTLVAKANVIKDEKPCPVSIYQLDEKEDYNYLSKLPIFDRSWKCATFLETMTNNFIDKFFYDSKRTSHSNFYVMEDENQKCLGYVQVNDENEDKQDIVHIETTPSNRFYKSFKYIGETFLSFLVKQQKTSNNKKQIIVQNAVEQAYPFYIKSGFAFADYNIDLFDMFLPQKDEDKLLANNKEHTKSEIELVG